MKSSNPLSVLVAYKKNYELLITKLIKYTYYFIEAPTDKLLHKKISFILILRYTIVLFLLVMFFACNQVSKVNGPKYSDTIISPKIPVYHFAIHPLHNPNKLRSSYQPLIDYLNEKITGVQFEIEASKNYALFEHKYKGRKTEFILPNPWQTIQAIKFGYNVIAMAGDPKDFKGLIIVRKDGGITKPSDLIGKTVCYPAATALAACIMPQFFFFI